MTPDPATIPPSTLAFEALRQMTPGEGAITQLLVCDPDGGPLGLLDVRDLPPVGVRQVLAPEPRP